MFFSIDHIIIVIFLGGKILGLMALSGFGVAAGAVLLSVGIFILPAYGGYKYHKKRKVRKRRQNHLRNYAWAKNVRELKPSGKIVLAHFRIIPPPWILQTLF